CPYCYTIHMNEGVLSDVAYCKKCKKNFVQCCGAKYSPINAHGNGYHRPSCNKYEGETITGDVEYEENCIVCKAIKTKEGFEIPCEAPLELNEIGEIRESERENNENY